MINNEKQVIRGQLPENLESEKEIRGFFHDFRHEKYFLITYDEFLQIFDGIDIDYNYVTKINKQIIYAHLNYFNDSYNSLWSYKWYPVFLKFVYNTCRRKPTSFVLTFGYLWLVDYFFEVFALSANKHRRNIKINTLFDYHLSKETYVERRKYYMQRYLKIINSKIHNGETFTNTSKIKTDIILSTKKTEDELVWGESLEKMDENEANLLQKRTPFMDGWDEFLKMFNKVRNQPSELGKYFDHNSFSGYLAFINSNLRLFSIKFAEYKRSYSQIPRRSDYEVLLKYGELNQHKYIIFGDEVKKKFEKFFLNSYYITTGKIYPKAVNFSYMRDEDDTDDRHPKLGLLGNYTDLVLFTCIAILPSKLFSARRGSNMIRALFRSN